MPFCLKRILLLTIPLLCHTALMGQKSTDKAFPKVMREADEYYYYDSDNQKAAELYSTLLASNPGHANLQSKLGTCYLNIDGKKTEALELLKEALENIVDRDRNYSDLGEKAPLDTYLYLGVAYLMNDSIEKAITAFNNAREKLANTDLFRDDYIDNQIKNCQYALEMKKGSLPLEKRLLASWLSDYPGAGDPVLSANDSIFIFTQDLGEINKIFISYYNEGWSVPVDITREFGNYDKLYTNSISGDGSYLVLSMDSQGDGNLYYSQRKNNGWSKIKSLGKEINTGYWESHGFITPDGQTLYFSSNRNGGRGDLDIWVSAMNPDGSWGTPKNLGDVINSSYNEDTPYFDTNNSALIFSSAGRTGMGDYDVYISYLDQGKWTTPAGLPSPFNTTGSDLFFIPLKDTTGYISSVYDEDAGYRSIYIMTEGVPAPEIIAFAETDNTGENDVRDSIIITDMGPVADTLPATEMEPGPEPIAASETSVPYLNINSILFGFDSSELDEQARSELDKLIGLLNEHNDFRIEIAGFTDAVGNSEYNLSLSRARVDAAFNYLLDAGIGQNRIVRKAYGETNFVAVNTNTDGTDNPEGRQYNRRVVIGIIDEQSGATIHLEPFTPDHLRLRSAMKYSVVLMKSERQVADRIFESLEFNSRLFLKSMESDNVQVYSIGIFFSKREANEFLAYVGQEGFPDAFVINQYQLADELASIDRVTEPKNLPAGTKRYTIQILATRGEAETNIFEGLEGVTKVEGNDGYIRYIIGEYDNFSETGTDLLRLRDSGFPDAFVRETIDL